jgi:endonuclease/exonuclease/phosphatase family metal-dependent hydrolase
LVRKDLPLRVELRTHKDRPIQFLYAHERGKTQDPGASSHYFSRDCAELKIYNAESSRPALIVLLVHLKSKLDPEGIDPQGRERRRAEMNTLIKIYHELRGDFTPAVPILIAGDFNGCARRDRLSEEFQALLSSDLESVVEAAGLAGEMAATQVQFNRNGQIHCMQIDFIFMSAELKTYLIPSGVEVYRYRSDLKVILPLPKTLEQRTLMPSDHYPVVATFKNFLLERE